MGSCVIVQERHDGKWIYELCENLSDEITYPFLSSRATFDTVEMAISHCRDIAILSDEGIHIRYYPTMVERSFQDELRALINKHSKENDSDTPDYILAEYLNSCLEAYNHATKLRTTWYSPEGS